MIIRLIGIFDILNMHGMIYVWSIRDLQSFPLSINFSVYFLYSPSVHMYASCTCVDFCVLYTGTHKHDLQLYPTVAA